MMFQVGFGAKNILSGDSHDQDTNMPREGGSVNLLESRPDRRRAQKSRQRHVLPITMFASRSSTPILNQIPAVHQPWNLQSAHSSPHPHRASSNPAAVPMFDGFWSLTNTPQLIGLTSLPKRGATRCSGAAWWVTQDRNGTRASTPPPPSPPITIHPAHPLQPSHRRQLPLGNKMRPPRTPIPTPLLNPMIPRGTHARPLELLLPLQLLPATPLFLDQALDDRVSCG